MRDFRGRGIKKKMRRKKKEKNKKENVMKKKENEGGEMVTLVGYTCVCVVTQVGRRRPLQGVTGPRRVLAGLRGAGPGVLGTPGTCHRMGPLLGPSPHPSPLSPTPRSPTPTRTPLARRVSLQKLSQTRTKNKQTNKQNKTNNSLSLFLALALFISLLFPP